MVAVGLVGIAVYRTFDPATAGFFPPCPVRALTGWLCAGCGSQRAVHALLHGEAGAAWASNPLLVVALPYVGLGYVFRYASAKPLPWARRWRLRLYGREAIWAVCAIVIVYSVARNVAGASPG